ncbi:MAG: hypothetical protein OHK0039_43440 [Bacteroidia bacterium]
MTHPTQPLRRYDTWQPHLLIVALFLLAAAPTLWGDGMFLDGLWYATLARNLAVGTGSFWAPHLTATVEPVFTAHPPLAFGLQSLLFRLLGDHYYVERLYSLLCYLLATLLLRAAWRHVRPGPLAWWPVLLWSASPLLVWSVSNNMLENTLQLWLLGAVWALLRRYRPGGRGWLVLAGGLLSAALLTKGPVGLFVWAMPGCWWLAHRSQMSWRQALADTALLVLCTLALPLVLYLAMPPVRAFAQAYLDLQLTGSLPVQSVPHRLALLLHLLTELLPALGLCALMLLAGRRIPPLPTAAPALAATGLLAVLPYLFFLKQRQFYLLPAMPLLALALAAWTAPLVETRLLPHLFRLRRLYAGIALILAAATCGLSLHVAGQPERDAPKLELAHALVRQLAPGTLLQSCSSLRADMQLHGYLARYARVDLAYQSRKPAAGYLTGPGCAETDTLCGDLLWTGTAYRLYRCPPGYACAWR